MKESKINIEAVERFLREQLDGGKNVSVTIHLSKHRIEKFEFNFHARTDEEINSALGGK